MLNNRIDKHDIDLKARTSASHHSIGAKELMLTKVTEKY